ncbi:MAG: bifunctional DNA-formamidopyrimidine glycosylase/DNA-(apurinic or apyrimidinic site) lyase, partial [Proteobacteria bacterium]|nr:bifunctional DNA-formamidopyrimidine glycosylase/DNA-(apurinic or apyrimidinic site) lyase [Pseudomonadota bacterium]
MPELPEVETVRAGLHDRLRGRVLETVEQRRADLRIPFPPRFAARLRGRHLDRIARRGKYLLWHFCGGPVLIAHLGMSGRWVLRDDNGAPPLPHEHVVLTFAGGAVACYRDPRRFGLMTLAADEDLAAHPLLADMGPEPLTPAFDGAVLARAFRGRRAPVKSLLLDQRVVAGLGNIYACEALFRAGIAPDRAAGRLRADRTLRLADSVREVLADAITAGGSS